LLFFSLTPQLHRQPCFSFLFSSKDQNPFFCEATPLLELGEGRGGADCGLDEGPGCKGGEKGAGVKGGEKGPGEHNPDAPSDSENSAESSGSSVSCVPVVS